MWRYLDSHFEELLGSFLLAVMVTIAFINVVVRYGSSFSFAWTEEITVNLFVWVTLLGTARAYREGSHLSMSIVYNAFPKSARFCFYLLGCALCVIFFGALFYTGVLEVMDEYDLDAISESMGIPVWWYTLATPLFSLLIIYRMAQRAVQDLSLANY